jgi:hypothetical protein
VGIAGFVPFKTAGEDEILTSFFLKLSKLDIFFFKEDGKDC